MKFISLILLTACSAPTGLKSKPYTETNPPPKPQDAIEVYNHGGSILTSANIEAIFWGNTWVKGEKYKGIIEFLEGITGSNYLNSVNEYGVEANNIIYKSITWVNSKAPSLTEETSGDLAKEACKLTQYKPDPNTIYMFFTDSLPGDNKTCAWHSSFWCQTGEGDKVTATMIYIPNLDDVDICDPNDSTSEHSKGLARAANVTAHELVETITNPFGDGWYAEEEDNLCSEGQQCEIGDKAAWVFGNNLVTLSNNSKWKLQMEWSNKAYEAGTGIPNRLNQFGCVDGE